jgi:putative tryptophan/tyrosine transport system substrate-binding protein
MRRRDFMTVLAGAAAYPLSAGAQQKAMPAIGILGAVAPDVTGVQLNLAAFREGLGETGFAEGQNVVVEYRWAERRLDRLPALAAELVARKVDVIVTEGGDSTTFAAKQATSTIPVVFHCTSDPVALGIVASLARPGGNLTGVSLMHSELALKLFEMKCCWRWSRKPSSSACCENRVARWILNTRRARAMSGSMSYRRLASMKSMPRSRPSYH